MASSTSTSTPTAPQRAPGLHPGAGARRARLCAGAGLHIGIHTSSAVNNAEIAPFVGEAVDTYLRQNVELARLGCEWVIVHGGFHFGDVPRRREAAVARIQRLHEVAAEKKVPLWFENHNKEPERAEIHYLPHNAEELRCSWTSRSRSIPSGSAGASTPPTPTSSRKGSPDPGRLRHLAHGPGAPDR